MALLPLRGVGVTRRCRMMARHIWSLRRNLMGLVFQKRMPREAALRQHFRVALRTTPASTDEETRQLDVLTRTATAEAGVGFTRGASYCCS
jgi:hypothetical protein